jgi:hypothetical protein
MVLDYIEKTRRAGGHVSWSRRDGKITVTVRERNLKEGWFSQTYKNTVAGRKAARAMYEAYN